MWSTNPWDIYKGMAKDKMREAFSRTKALLREGAGHKEVMRQCDELGRRIEHSTKKMHRFLNQTEPGKSDRRMLDILFPLQCLEEPKDEPGILRGTITINGVHFHVEAIEVEYIDGVQHGASMEADSFLDDMPYRDGAWETVPFQGKEYVLHIFPHAG